MFLILVLIVIYSYIYLLLFFGLGHCLFIILGPSVFS